MQINATEIAATVIGEENANRWSSVGSITGWYISNSNSDCMLWGDYKGILPMVVRRVYSYQLCCDNDAFKSICKTKASDIHELLHGQAGSIKELNRFHSLVLFVGMDNKDVALVIPISYIHANYDVWVDLCSALESEDIVAFTTDALVYLDCYQLFSETIITYSRVGSRISPTTFCIYGESVGSACITQELTDTLEQIARGVFAEAEHYERMLQLIDEIPYIGDYLADDPFLNFSVTVHSDCTVNYAFNIRNNEAKIAGINILRNVIAAHHWYIYAGDDDKSAYDLSSVKKFLLGEADTFSTVLVKTRDVLEGSDLNGLLSAYSKM